MKKSTYMWIDIFLLTGITCLLEAVNIFAVQRIFPDSLFTLSIMVPMAALVMMRWNAGAAVTAVASGLVYCILLGASWQQYLIYGAGSAFILLNLLWFRFAPHKKIAGNVWLSLLFVLTAYLLTGIGRAVMSLVSSSDFFNNLAVFLFSDALNLLIGMLIIFIARKQKGMFEYQKDYLARLEKERNEAAEKENYKNTYKKSGIYKG